MNCPTSPSFRLFPSLHPTHPFSHPSSILAPPPHPTKRSCSIEHFFLAFLPSCHLLTSLPAFGPNETDIVASPLLCTALLCSALLQLARWRALATNANTDANTDMDTNTDMGCLRPCLPRARWHGASELIRPTRVSSDAGDHLALIGTWISFQFRFHCNVPPQGSSMSSLPVHHNPPLPLRVCVHKRFPSFPTPSLRALKHERKHDLPSARVIRKLATISLVFLDRPQGHLAHAHGRKERGGGREG